MTRARHVIEAFSAERLRTLRRERRLSQEQLARSLAAAASDSAVTRERLKIVAYEGGTRRPAAKALHALAAALGVDAAELLDPEAPMTVELLRALRNLTQGQVAAHLGITQARYSQLESGQAQLDPQRREQLAELLRVPLDALDELLAARGQGQP
ncbi:helix-turn-helix protein [Krasilnikovia cinnamomea]|uniref:Helix-turn-helix protein n=1 Tax=Krasilnikovia cinnamomea TaxID=349313 RepID=A0A4Q7Z9V3_9ACTN|nr:helix-turn-helix transcriptional regulator [Krasilnikovia cinnamomea]RZU46653.1 helix-turn-helix protein [Krasilnikovia cinnamomea]